LLPCGPGARTQGDGYRGARPHCQAADAKLTDRGRVDDQNTVARLLHLAGQEIDRSDEIGDEARAGRLVDFARRANLAQPSPAMTAIREAIVIASA
jgi:hypothetical protein